MEKKYLFVVLSILIIGLASASFTLDDRAINKKYLQNSFLSGNLNISFSGESYDSMFTDSRGNEISLGEVLNFSINYDYTCTSEGCIPNYVSSNLESSKSFHLNAGQEKIVGFTFQGVINSVDLLEFSLSSNAPASSLNQIEIDFFDDGSIITGNSKIGGDDVSKKNYGCFEETGGAMDITVGYSPYCQKVYINETPSLNIGGYVKKILDKNDNILMRFYSSDGTYLKNCIIPKENILESGSEVYCEIDYFIVEPDYYYICMGLNNGYGNYLTKGYSDGTDCGFQGAVPQNSVATYRIGYIPKMFGSVGQLDFINVLPNGKILSDEIEAYLLRVYDGGNCENTCYVPIKINSLVSQDITINNIKLVYDKPGLQNLQLNEIQDLVKTPSLVNSNLGLLDISDLFSLGEAIGNFTYTLVLGGIKVFDENLEVIEETVTLSPNYSVVYSPTNYVLSLPGIFEADKYEWFFSDGTNYSTNVNYIEHEFNQSGNFTVKVILVSDSMNITQNFLIEIGSGKEGITKILEKKQSELDGLKLKLVSMSYFEKEMFGSLFDLDALENNLTMLSEKLDYSTDESEYLLILEELNLIEIPLSIGKMTDDSSIFFSNEYAIKATVLSEITGSTHTEDESFFTYMKLWPQQNFENRYDKSEWVIDYGNGNEEVYYFYKFTLNSKPVNFEDGFFIMRDLSDLKYGADLERKSVSGYSYFSLKEGLNTLEFSTTEDVTIENEVFIAPLAAKEFGGEIPIDDKEFNYLLLVIYLVVLIIVSFAAYFGLHWWYSTKYEKHLFPNKNQLYNAIHYINNSINNKIERKTIEGSLLKAGWTWEQVSFLMKKYAGKNTGVPRLFPFMKKAGGPPTKSIKKLPPVKPIKRTLDKR